MAAAPKYFCSFKVASASPNEDAPSESTSLATWRLSGSNRDMVSVTIMACPVRIPHHASIPTAKDGNTIASIPTTLPPCALEPVSLNFLPLDPEHPYRLHLVLRLWSNSSKGTQEKGDFRFPHVKLRPQP
ncbi:hypothetical protein CsSME_00045497 [Camellia sinensis var. sinensis]